MKYHNDQWNINNDNRNNMKAVFQRSVLRKRCLKSRFGMGVLL